MLWAYRVIIEVVAIHQHILNLIELCVRKGVRQAVISPGSRSAPITLALARHPQVECRVVPDERSAGFVALGLAQQLGQPVILVCTSGSALYNLAPAVAEACFQHIPLLLLTADRPPEWIHQYDGQTIYQSGIFGKHVKQSYDFPTEFTHPDTRWYAERIGNEAIHQALRLPPGPVHINLPLREPLYPTAEESLVFEPVRIIEQLPAQATLPNDIWHRLLNEWEGSDRILIAVGQNRLNDQLVSVLRQLHEEWGTPVVSDIISNVHRSEGILTQHDNFLGQLSGERLNELRPDLLITCGMSFVSKQLKLFLRNHSPRLHWHLEETHHLTDPFQSLTTLIPHEPVTFFQKLFADLDFMRFREGDEDDADRTYAKQWARAEQQSLKLLHEFVARQDIFHELGVVSEVLAALPARSQLHLANSMPVRYANYCGLEASRRIEVFANRGTSGIDGCVSTAVGAALAVPDRLVTVLVGDVAFFYDRNALWNTFVPPNLRIVLLNNQGGNIFRLIDGPARQPELETYFETPHTLSARNTAHDADVDYLFADTYTDLTAALTHFFGPSARARLLEIRTDRETNRQQLSGFKKSLAEVFSV